MDESSQSVVASHLNFSRSTMRKRYRVLLFASILAAVVAPFGFALSFETSHAAVAVASAPSPAPQFLPDAAKLLLVGTTLLGLAAFVRRAS